MTIKNNQAMKKIKLLFMALAFMLFFQCHSSKMLNKTIDYRVDYRLRSPLTKWKYKYWLVPVNGGKSEIYYSNLCYNLDGIIKGNQLKIKYQNGVYNQTTK